MMQLIFNSIVLVFLLWMCFRWSTSTSANSMIKVILFLLSVVDIILIIKQTNIL